MRLEVSAQSVGVENVPLVGIAFALFDGFAVFGAAGAGVRGNDGRVATERVWVAGALPAGAVTHGEWNFLAPERMRTPTPASDSGQAQALADLYANPALQVLSAQERAQIYLLGVEGFTNYLTSRTDRADDVVDYSFVKVQTDVYRVRQLMLGSTAATRLAVSPSLASIAQAETATASQTQIADFIAELKVTPGVQKPAAMAPVSRAAKSTAKAAPATVTLARAMLAADKGTVLMGGSSARFTEIAVKETAVEPALKLQTATAGRQVFLESQITPIAVRPVAPPAPTPLDVVNASPLVGQSFVRTTTLAKRLEEPKSREARDYSTSSRFEAITSLIRLVDSLTDEDGGFVPGLFDGVDVHGLEDDGFLDDLPVVNSKKPVSRPFADFIANRALLPKLMQVPTRLPPGQATGDPDEAAMFSDTTDLSDHVVALMRKMEGRIKLYRDAITACQVALGGLRSGFASVRTRLTSIADDLAEARHDVSVARALLAEETQRIDDVNTRRTRVLAEDVQVPRLRAAARDREPADHARPTLSTPA